MPLNTQKKLFPVMYHYLRDVTKTKFAGLKSIDVDTFNQHLNLFIERFEIASLKSALDFLAGKYLPKKDLCLLTFDDGLLEHYTTVTPILMEKNISGLFFVPTTCIDDSVVLPVHKSHFLMAYLGFKLFQQMFLKTLRGRCRNIDAPIDSERASAIYRWDSPEVRNFKYFINYALKNKIRDDVLAALFGQVFHSEREFAEKLYMSWGQLREMQRNGMIIGGHTHTHPVLSDCSPQVQQFELGTCMKLIVSHLHAQTMWPFAYPFGKPHTFNDMTVHILRETGFTCAFSTEVGINQPRQNVYSICRLDPKDF